MIDGSRDARFVVVAPAQSIVDQSAVQRLLIEGQMSLNRQRPWYPVRFEIPTGLIPAFCFMIDGKAVMFMDHTGRLGVRDVESRS